MPKLKPVQDKIKDVFKTGVLTNGKYVRQFEQNCAKFLGVKNAIAVSNGTSAIIISLKCLDLKGEVIMPSFTFSSAAHSLLWCGLTPVFVDIDRETFNIDPNLIEEKITQNTSAIFAAHIFGNPCNMDKIQNIAKKHKLKVIYDAAHAFGSTCKGRSIALFGDVSVFSLTPTKVLTAGEGGIIALNDSSLVEIFKMGRNNGDSYNRDEEFLGIAARMHEFGAIVGIEGLKILKKSLKRRLKLANLYKKELALVPGISFQKITEDCVSTYKDFTILVDENKFGAPRDELLRELLKNKIETRVYFNPPIHKKKGYREYKDIYLPNTEFVSGHIMNLPFYSDMPEASVRKVCSVIKNFHKKVTA